MTTENAADANYDDLDRGHLLHLLKLRDHQMDISRKFWIRAAKKAFAGDMGELRNRVALCEAPPVEIIQS